MNIGARMNILFIVKVKICESLNDRIHYVYILLIMLTIMFRMVNKFLNR